ncbi:PRC-barrel domain-containing protein [Kribbella sp. VKM Ac-2566]|uniref:PRC-barrel domain-containing protein n=1 Tax=Kribbella sp. VKM Ac-2566 TaxID=2512218 RepID=UPI001063D95E|nr:PRC-barrel domain-containing protein [Kribbella sp. VKM Ac-2566]TDW79605.1 PRC-barrel domain protein [Kribbella sp. VKM Ac-2566]
MTDATGDSADTADTAHALVRLTDVGLELADPADDLRGLKVLDRNDDEIGTVDGLIVDEQERRVRFLEVGSGGFLGLGQRKVMVPVEAVTSVDADAVHISQNRDHVAGGPVYDPEVVLERRHYEDVYGYYQYPPYWGPFPR